MIPIGLPALPSPPFPCSNLGLTTCFVGRSCLPLMFAFLTLSSPCFGPPLSFMLNERFAVHGCISTLYTHNVSLRINIPRSQLLCHLAGSSRGSRHLRHLYRRASCGYHYRKWCIPWFTRDGREVWPTKVIPVGGAQKVIKGRKSDVIGLEPVKFNVCLSGGYPWISPHGYDVTNDGWILNSRKKRLMWLPHYWRRFWRALIWDG